MSGPTTHIFFSGLDPVPIRVTSTAGVSEENLWSAAGLPPSHFIQTMRPYQLRQTAADAYELVIGPEGYGQELLTALRWLAGVAASGILTATAQEDVIAFVHHYLETVKPEWKYEELTEHAATFITDRYRRALQDMDYRQALERYEHDTTLMSLGTALQQWTAQRT
jgi:hypothetical protein